MYRKIQRIHLIGIGGIGMSGIATLLLRHGYAVSGSDRTSNESTRALETLGARIALGHAAENVEGAELVVTSSAVRPDNPEVLAAQSRDIPVIPRAEMLAELMRLKHGIAVAGAHGKTTTTSMIATILVAAGLDPTVVVGGRVHGLGGTGQASTLPFTANARLGQGEFMVVEADESDGSFNKLSASIAVVTNLDREHLDHYGTMTNLKKAFVAFLGKVPFYGLNVVCGDDVTLRTLAAKVTRRRKTYGFRRDNDFVVEAYRTEGPGSVCTVSARRADGRLESVSLRLRVPGRHNVLNALAALVVADEVGVPLAAAAAALEEFPGVERRFHVRGVRNGVTYVDDYAHHPSEIRATLSAARERFASGRLRVLFQPHRYSRTEDLFEDFARAFGACDTVAVCDVYAAGEAPRAGVDGPSLAEAIRSVGGTEAFYAPSPKDVLARWIAESTAGDAVLTLGAGDLPNVYRDLF
jgi:UDP-N-acetylmuramate--alanine ligase